MKTLGRMLLTAFLYAVVCTQGYAQTQVANQQTVAVPITSSGTTENALLYLPDDYNTTTTKYPLLVFLHGVGEAGTDLSRIYNNSSAGGPAYFIGRGTFPAAFTNPADGVSYKFMVLTPQASYYSTSAIQLDYVLQYMVKTYRVDATRIYLTGLSAGGEGIVNYAAHNTVTPTYSPAAFVPMSAAISAPPQRYGDSIAAHNTRTWGFGSYSEDIFGENTSKLVDVINNAKSGLARFTNYSGGHCCWNRYYDPAYKQTIDGRSVNIYEWMLQFSTGNTGNTPGANQAPTAGAGPDQTITWPVDSATLVGSGTDVDGTIVKYEWSTVTGPTSVSTPHAKPGGRSFTLRPDAQAHLVIDNSGGTYRAGDTLYLSGYFKSVAFSNMSGAADNYITVTNVPGQTLIIGDSTWSGGAWAQGLVFRGCHYIEVAGNNKSNFKIIGSNSTATDANGNPVKTAYFNMALSELSDNFVVHDITIRYGGAGIWAKTEVSTTNSATWYPNTYLNNFEFYNLDIGYTFNEAMYIGHTATYWNISTNTPYYPSPTAPTPDPAIYKRPVKLTNVKIHDNYIHDIGNDAIQTAAIDNLELYNNEITRWATKQGSADNGGILIGGRVKGFSMHDNYVHDGWGELLQVYAEGGANSLIYNNLLVSNKLDGVSFRGSNDLIITFTNNTVIYAGYNATRINGYYGQTSSQIFNKNLLINPDVNTGNVLSSAYIYTENGAKVTAGTFPNDNKKYASITGLSIDQQNYFQPASTSAVYGYGYIRNGGSGVHTIVSPNSPVTVVRGLKEGTYVFRLTVTDNDGATATDDVTVVVRAAPVNQSPKANAGTDTTITLPANSVALNGSGTDADGTISTYRWAKISGPAQFAITSAGSAATTVTNLAQGVYLFELTVTDNAGATGKDTVRVTVNVPVNKLPVADAGADQTIILPVNSVTLSGSATDEDGTISSYSWTKISGPSQFTIASAGSTTTAVNNLVVGIYLFVFAATDNNGGVDRDTVQVTVNADPTNQLPVVNAGTSQTITLPANSVTLSGSATDTDGTISSYSWTKISGPAQFTIVNANSTSTTVNNLVAGVYLFELEAIDDKGGVGTDTVMITVNPDPNKLPVASAGANQTITLPANSVTLNGSGTDTDGTISSYSWTKISGPAQFTITSANSAGTTVTNLVAGVYQFVLTVTDDKGAAGRDTVQVTVLVAPNKAPVANAGKDSTIQLPAPVINLNGTASYDPDGQIASYSWTKVSGPNPFTMTGFNTATPSLLSALAGTYVFRLTVTDDKGATATDDVQIVVLPGNKIPVANAGADTTLQFPAHSIMLDGGRSKDDDGTIVSYSWKQIAGPETATITSATAVQTMADKLVVGKYKFVLSVTDNKGAIGKDTITVDIQNPYSYAEAVSVYPNPTTDVLNYMIFSEHSGKIRIAIVDVNGKIVKKAEVQNRTGAYSNSIDVRSLGQKGIYFFQLQYPDGRRKAIKFIKN